MPKRNKQERDPYLLLLIGALLLIVGLIAHRLLYLYG